MRDVITDVFPSEPTIGGCDGGNPSLSWALCFNSHLRVADHVSKTGPFSSSFFFFFFFFFFFLSPFYLFLCSSRPLVPIFGIDPCLVHWAVDRMNKGTQLKLDLLLLILHLSELFSAVVGRCEQKKEVRKNANDFRQGTQNDSPGLTWSTIGFRNRH
jgi:hypothetical protein